MTKRPTRVWAENAQAERKESRRKEGDKEVKRQRDGRGRDR
jgi:hypothetical protein